MRIFFLKLAIASVISMQGLSCFAAQENKIETEILAAHNHFRTQHGSPNLVWDETLAQYAKKYAIQCYFKHSASPYGENLAAGYPTITEAINGWYSENAQYAYDKPGFSPATGHFTQLIWKSSQKIGCAYVACDGKNGTPGNYLVCEYEPRGNMINKGFFEKNVLPLSSPP